MSQRQDKKLRKLYRKDVRKRVEQQQEVVNQHIQEFKEKLEKLLRPAPFFIPEFIWIQLQKLFLNI